MSLMLRSTTLPKSVSLRSAISPMRMSTAAGKLSSQPPVIFIIQYRKLILQQHRRSSRSLDQELQNLQSNMPNYGLPSPYRRSNCGMGAMHGWSRSTRTSAQCSQMTVFRRYKIGDVDERKISLRLIVFNMRNSGLTCKNRIGGVLGFQS